MKPASQDQPRRHYDTIPAGITSIAVGAAVAGFGGYQWWKYSRDAARLSSSVPMVASVPGGAVLGPRRVTIEGSMSMLAAGLTILVVLGALGCKDQDRNYCADAPHHNCLYLDAGIMPCTSDQQCAPNVCDLTGSRACVQCTLANPGACTAMTPICGTDNACRGCTTHAECGSNVCLADGSCATETSVAYVAPGGSDGSGCTRSQPCRTLDAGLKQGRAYVKMATGLMKDTKTTTIDGQTVTILADVGAQLDRDGDGPILTVTGAGAVVQIYDLEITGASGAAGADGIQLTANGGNPSLTLTRVTVDGNQGNGVQALGGMLSVSQSTITNNQGAGITMSGGTLAVGQSATRSNQAAGITMSNGILTVGQSTIMSNQAAGITMSNGTLTVSQSAIAANQVAGITISGGTFLLSRSVVSANQGGGVVMTGSGTQFAIRNNFIYRNGNNATASVGGLSLLPTGNSNVEFNTIADNEARVAGFSAGGVFCDAPGFVAAHNIIFRNTGGADGNVQTVGDCTYGDSFNMRGASNVDNSPGFAHPNAAPLDYHLTAASPPSIVDAAGPCTGVDFDGDTRPIGKACDLGADERNP